MHRHINRVFLLLACALITTDLASAACNRSAQDALKREGWNVYPAKEFNYVDYVKYIGCPVAGAFVPLVGAACLKMAKYEIYEIVRQFSKVQESKLLDLLSNGKSIFTGSNEVKVLVHYYSCEACDCCTCVKGGIPRVADCGRCGQKCACRPEPNRVAFVVVTRPTSTSTSAPAPAPAPVPQPSTPQPPPEKCAHNCGKCGMNWDTSCKKCCWRP
jgi:hypothetical protein